VVFGLVSLVVGFVMLVVGTRFRTTVAGNLLIIFGGVVVGLGVILLGIEGMTRMGDETST
jgi:hypothetical protein